MPCPALPCPALPSLADATQAQALTRVERRGQRQDAGAPGLWSNFVRSMAQEHGWYGWWGAGVEGMGCATAGPTFVGFCRTQEITSGVVLA